MRVKISAMFSLSAAPTVTKSARSAAAATAAADPQCRRRPRPQVAVMWRSPSWRSTTWGLRPWRRSSPTSTQTARPASTQGTQSHSSKQQTPTPYQGSRRTANIICQVIVVRPCLVITSIDLGPRALHMLYIPWSTSIWKWIGGGNRLNFELDSYLI